MIPFDESGVFQPGEGDAALRRLAVRGAVATVTATGLSLFVQVISTVILARLLTPADFGVVTMVTTFSLLLVSFGLNGFSDAIIQFKEVDRYTASNLFWFNASAGLALALLFIAAGSLLARFYGNPLVANVAVGLSPGIFIASLSVIHIALLKRTMRFVGASANDVIGRVVNTVVSIAMAFAGWGYWALVAGILAQQLSVTIGGWWLCRWVPSFPRRTGKTRPYVYFALKVYGRYCFGYATQNIDNLLVGWRFNAGALGFYKKAYDLFALSGSQLVAPLHNVALASLSRLTQDPIRFRRYLANALGIVAFVGMAVSADLSLVGMDVIRLVLGPKWSESGRIFELFGPGIGAMLLCGAFGWIHLSLGKPERWFRWSLIELGFTVSLFLVALHWGPPGIAAAWSISYWALLIPGFWYAGRQIGFGASALIESVWRYVLAALFSGLVTAAIIRDTRFWQTPQSAFSALWGIIVISALMSTIYLATTILLYRGLSPLRMCVSLLSELAPSHKATERQEEATAETS